MSMTEERHPTEDLAAYALGALDESEATAVASHLETCDRCARDLAQFEDALYEAAVVGAARAETPRDLRRRIVLPSNPRYTMLRHREVQPRFRRTQQ